MYKMRKIRMFNWMKEENIDQSKWSPEETQILINLCSKALSYEEMFSSLPNKNINQIRRRIFRLNLQKLFDGRVASNATKNKTILGRDLSFEYCQSIASKYISRGEFQRKDGSVYQTARRKQWLEKICKHMNSTESSLPQLIIKKVFEDLLSTTCEYNTRKIIPPYELDLYFPNYDFAVEINGDWWHKDKERDRIKNQLCKQQQINLLTIECTNRWTEAKLKNAIIVQLEFINSILKTKWISSDINNIEIILSELIVSLQDIKAICKTYKSVNLFIKEQPKLYSKLCRLKLVEEYTEHMSRKKPHHLNEVVDKINSCKTFSEFKEKYPEIYLWCGRYRKQFLLLGLQGYKTKVRKTNY